MTEETNCYECDTPLVSVCPQCNPHLSAAPSPDGEEVERVADQLRRFVTGTVDEYEIDIRNAARAAIAAMRQEPTHE